MWRLGAREMIEDQRPEEDSRELHFDSSPALVYRNIDLFGKVGLQCYNLQKGTNLQFLALLKYNTWITTIYSHRITLEAIDPVDHSSCEFETQVRHAVQNRGCLSAITTLCRLKPQTPEEEEDEDVYGCITWHEEAVDDFFKGDMPDWITEDALTASDKLQYYEIEEENEWLHLYAELALFSKWQSNLKAMASSMPFEMRRIVVRTREDVEPKKKVKAENAIFYICFKTRCGRDCKAIIRKTTDRIPGHFSFEVKCLM